MNRFAPGSRPWIGLAPVFILAVACGVGDTSRPAGAEPLSLASAETVLHEDFSGPARAWELVDGTWAHRARAGGEAVFAQTATDRDFPVALLPEPTLGDLDVEVRFRPLSGSVDASGGLVFRARDGRNYYLVRANALEDNFRLYRIEDGERRQIASTRIEAPALGRWHALRVVAVGDRIQAFLDGELLIDHRDGRYASGRVGLWTKADAVTEFDDLVVRASVAPLDARAIGKAAGTEATRGADGVVRIAWARRDVELHVDGAPLDPAAGLGSWAAFRPSPAGALVMGDTVVFEDEITPALDAAIAAGLHVTALHNHFAFDRPPVYFMHLGGQGSAESLAAGVKAVWDAIQAVRAEHPRPREGFPGDPPEPGELDAEALADILGHEAKRKGRVVKVTIPRQGRAHGASIGGSMGLATWAAFSGSDAAASVDGDFIMTAREVQPVIRALRRAGIHVVALHNHMLEDEPRFFFLHYWGKGPAPELAAGLRGALDAQRGAESSRTRHARWGYERLLHTIPDRSGRLRSLGEDAQVAVADEEPVAPLAGHLPRDAKALEERHPGCDCGKGETGRLADGGQGEDRARLERFVDPERRARPSRHGLDPTPVLLERRGEALRRVPPANAASAHQC